jgi:hypothetical protein
VTTGVKVSGAACTLVHLFPACPCSFHSFQSHTLSMKHKQSLSNMSEHCIGPFLFTLTDPMTGSFGNGLGACENATFILMDDDHHERPLCHIQILRTFPCMNHTGKSDNFSLDSDFRPLADLGISTFRESHIYWQVKAPPGLSASLPSGTLLTSRTQEYH